MAISDSSPDTFATTDDADSLRRRFTATPCCTTSSSSSSIADKLNKVSNGGDVDRIVDSEPEPKAVNGGPQEFDAAAAAAAVKYSYRPSSPAHRKVKESPLSSDAIFRQSHAGLFNLCVVVLVAVNSRLIIENLMKYGLLIRAGFWFSSKSLRDWPLFMCCLSLPIFPLVAFLVEKLARTRRISDPVVVVLHTLIAALTILYPVFVILRFDSAVQSGVVLMLFACTMWLKLVSYAHTNYDMRSIAKASAKDEESTMELPYDVNFKSLVYFMMAPTLCYQVLGNINLHQPLLVALCMCFLFALLCLASLHVVMVNFLR